MRLISRMPVFAKIMWLVALMVALLAGISVFALQELRTQNENYTQLINSDASAALHLQEAVSERYNYNRILTGLVAQSALNELDGMDKYPERLKASADALKAHFGEVLDKMPDLKQEVEAIDTQFDAIEVIVDREVDAAITANAIEAWKIYTQEVRPLLEGAFTNDLNGLSKDVFQAVKDATQTAADNYRSAVRNTIIVSVVGTVFVSLLAYLLTRVAITRPLQATVDILGKLARGETTSGDGGQRIGTDEIGRCHAAAIATGVALDRLVADMREVISAAHAGDLTAHADPERHSGEFAMLVRGVNELVEILSAPTREAASVIQHLAGGDLKGRMNGSYEGDLRAFKMNMNRSLDALGELLGELGQTFRLLEGGDLRGVLVGAYPGDFAQLQSAVNRSIAQLHETLLSLATDTDHVSSSAVETSAAAQQVARTSAAQLQTLTQISKAIDAVSSSMTRIAANAEASNRLTRSAVELVGTGSERLAALIAAVQRIAEGQTRVERITDTITRIADKTHVLAINAGLEAARAGEHGIGFGFVAQQIGKLAEEAAVAARDITAIITTAVEDIGRSAQDAGAASAAIGEVVTATREAGVNVAAITEAIGAQSKEVVSLAKRVEEMQAGGQETAAAAEEISVTMENLVRLATANLAMVGKLKLVKPANIVEATAQAA